MPNLSDQKANVTDATRAEFYGRALAAKRELEDAQQKVRSLNGVYRGELKEAKKAGVDTDAITRTLNARLEDPEVVVRRDQEYIRMRVIAGGMPKDQLAMFSDMFAEAPLPQDIFAKMTSERVYDDGVFSGCGGKHRSTNPHPPGSDHYDVWDRAWMAGQTKIADGLAPPKKAPRAAKKGKLDPMAEAAE